MMEYNQDEFDEWLRMNKDKVRSAKNVIVDLVTEVVSLVYNPAVQDSKEVIFKSMSTDMSFNKSMKSESSILVKADSVDDVFYAAVLIPDRVDLQGDIVPAFAIIKSAHLYLKKYREVDNEHNLKTGVAEVVESWTSKQETNWGTTTGNRINYPAGTWFMGVEPREDMLQKIKAGEITGFSIYGRGATIESESLKKKGEISMDDEIKNRFDQIEKQISASKSEFDYDKMGEVMAKCVVSSLEPVMKAQTAMVEMLTKMATPLPEKVTEEEDTRKAAELKMTQEVEKKVEKQLTMVEIAKQQSNTPVFVKKTVRRVR